MYYVICQLMGIISNITLHPFNYQITFGRDHVLYQNIRILLGAIISCTKLLYYRNHVIYQITKSLKFFNQDHKIDKLMNL